MSPQRITVTTSTLRIPTERSIWTRALIAVLFLPACSGSDDGGATPRVDGMAGASAGIPGAHTYPVAQVGLYNFLCMAFAPN